MREAIGSSMLLNIVIVIIGIISAFYISSIAYSKAFKVKNRIISVIERYDGACFNDIDDNDSCYQAIEAELQDIGYSSNISADCEEITVDNDINSIKSVELVYPSHNYDGGHRYCVYKYSVCSGSGSKCNSYSNRLTYYKVVTFMHFDIPVIHSFLEFPVSGETKTFYSDFKNINKRGI